MFGRERGWGIFAELCVLRVHWTGVEGCFCKSLHPEVLPRGLCSVKAWDQMRNSHRKPVHFLALDPISSDISIVSYVLHSFKAVLNYSALLFRVILNKDLLPHQLLMNRLLWPKAFALLLLMCLSGIRPEPCELYRCTWMVFFLKRIKGVCMLMMVLLNLVS